MVCHPVQCTPCPVYSRILWALKLCKPISKIKFTLDSQDLEVVMVVVVVIMVEEGQVCVQLVYHLVSVCFVKEVNCFCVMSVFMIL